MSDKAEETQDKKMLQLQNRLNARTVQDLKQIEKRYKLALKSRMPKKEATSASYSRTTDSRFG